jgi:hypothetical protein
MNFLFHRILELFTVERFYVGNANANIKIQIGYFAFAQKLVEIEIQTKIK